MALKLRPPVSILIVGCLFLATGLVGLADVVDRLVRERMIGHELPWMALVRLLAVVGGIFLLCRQNWARWLLVAWLMFHVVHSAFHTRSELLVHAALLVVIAYFLFRRRASAYFAAAG